LIFLAEIPWERFEEKRRYWYFSLEGLKLKTKERIQVGVMTLGTICIGKGWWLSAQISLTRFGFCGRI
jgi:hypothetical protein